MTRLTGAVVLALAIAGGAAGSSGSMSGWLVLEGRGIYCGLELFPHEGNSRFLACWRPRNGFIVGMTHRRPARAQTSRVHRGHRPPVFAGVLRTGQTAWVDRNRSAGRGAPPDGALFWCSARPRSITCKNGAGYGWRLGRVRGWQLITQR